MTVDAVLARLTRVRRSGRGWIALCPAHGDRHHSLSIGFENGRILLKCFVDCDIRDICSALNIRLRDLFGPGGNGRFDNARSDARRLEYARQIWQHTGPVVGTAVETYLRNRGINLEVPATIRLFRWVICSPEYPRQMKWPALVGRIQAVDGKSVGISVTALCADGSGKAPFGDGDSRRIFGPYRSGAVRLTTQLDAQLAIGEGIETMLSVQQATRMPSWAALSASNLPHVLVPDCVRGVIVCADADATGEVAAQRLARRLMGEGKNVRIARPPADFKDFNDALVRG